MYSILMSGGINSVVASEELLTNKAPKIWDLVSKEMKQDTTLNEFNDQSQSLEVRKLSLTTLQKLPYTDRVHYTLSFKMTNVV